MANDIIDIVVTDNSDNVQLNVTPNLVSINVSQTSGNIIGSNYYLASTYGALPITGDTTTLYVINDTSLMYRWSGSAYVQINSSAVVAWGQITGALSSQTDLTNALNAKAPLASPTFTGTVSGITKAMVGLSNVDNTTDANKPISSATQTALDTKAPLASPTFTGTVSGITKSMVGLGNVDNTTDLLKPISTATQSALNLKYDASNPSGYTNNVGTVTSVGGTGTVSGLSLSGSVTTSGNLTLGGTLSLTSGNVTTALGYTPYNASNPSGYISGITSGQITTALGYTPENSANKGIANGYASLDGGGLVPSAQLPSYVDDVLEFTNLAGFPATGTTGKIYVALDTNKIYRWSGATYIEVSPTVGTIWGGITGTLSNQTDLQNALNLKYNTPSGTTAQYVAGDGSLIAFPVAGQSGTIVRLVRNQTGATITKGTVVYISGATGNNPIVSKAIATGDATSAQTFGLCQSDIANNATGYVVTMGDLIGLDTSAFTEGQQLYLSGTVAGTYTATKQYAPIHLVYIGVITRAHPNLGQIEVKIQNGYELDEIHDVSAQNPANNDIIAFNTSNSLWEKKSIATALGFTPVTNARTITINGTALDLSANRSYSVGTVTSVSALTLGTTGTDVSSTVATGTTTPVITLNIPTASATNRGALSSADWTTFNGKQNALGYTAANDSLVVHLAGTETITGQKTFNPSVTAASAIARGTNLTPTLVASANSDVLVGLDINPTFTNGAFTGVKNYWLQLSGNGIINGTNQIGFNRAGAGVFFADSTQTVIGSVGLAIPIRFALSGLGFEVARFSGTNGNLLLNTTTDAGYRLDVAGTTRFQGTTASDTAPLGSELAGVTGTGTNWALAGGATNLNVGGYVHTVGDVTPLTTSLAAVNGTYYQITYTITGRTAGSITIAYGGTSTSGITATGNTGPLASSTAVLTITPTTDFNGTVVLSIKTIGTSSASSTFANSSGVASIEVRAVSAGGNTFIGTSAGNRNTTGTFNVALGVEALQNNTTSGFNVAIGRIALQNNTLGSQNTAIGHNTLNSNTTGIINSVLGSGALAANTTGSFNTALGGGAGRFIANGSTTNAITDNSIYLGYNTKALANNQTNQIVIGYDSTGLGSNTTVLGNSSTTTTAIYGNLSLGSTVDSGYKLDVTGTARVSGAATFSSNIGVGGGTPSIFTGYSVASFGSLSTTSNGITIASTTTGNGLIEFADGITGSQAYRGYIQYAHTSDSLILGTASSDRVTISSTGAATFSGSITSSLGSAGANFVSNAATTGAVNAYRISNTTGAASFGIDNSTGGDLITGGLAYATLLQSVSNTALQLGTNQTARMTITSGGNILMGTTSDNGERLYVSGAIRATSTITANSDIRIKSNITKIENALEKVGQISGYTYNTNYDDKRHGGVIAQEIDKVFPEIVNTGNDGLMGVEYGNISALLIEAIKEQQTQINELKELLKNK
jgi:hypothetical protein